MKVLRGYDSVWLYDWYLMYVRLASNDFDGRMVEKSLKFLRTETEIDRVVQARICLFRSGCANNKGSNSDFFEKGKASCRRKTLALSIAWRRNEERQYTANKRTASWSLTKQTAITTRTSVKSWSGWSGSSLQCVFVCVCGTGCSIDELAQNISLEVRKQLDAATSIKWWSQFIHSDLAEVHLICYLVQVWTKIDQQNEDLSRLNCNHWEPRISINRGRAPAGARCPDASMRDNTSSQLLQATAQPRHVMVAKRKKRRKPRRPRMLVQSKNVLTRFQENPI